MFSAVLYFIGQCQSGEHGRKVVRLDLLLVMACHPFWIWHESPSRTLGRPDATLATFWKRTSGTSSNELADQIWRIFSIEALAWLDGGGWGCWPVVDGGGRVQQILYTVLGFVSHAVYVFLLFVLVRALEWAALSACELQTQTHWVQSGSRAANSSSMFWEPIQCSDNPSLSWQTGNIVTTFLILSHAHSRPCSQAITSC